MDKKMTSGEIAKKAGVSQKAVRLYDEKGLLKPTDYSEGNYRLYDKAALQVLEKIVALKQIGFSLEEIRDNLVNGEASNIEDALRMQLKVMEEKRYRTEKVIDAINRTLDRKNEKLDWDDVAEIVQNVSLDQSADERHWDALKHTGSEEDWYVKIFKSLNIKKDEKILDLGCGFAKLWRNNVSEIPAGASIFAYDIHGSWADNFAEYLENNKGGLPEGVNISLEFENLEEESAWKNIEKNKKYDLIIAHYIDYELKNPEALVERASKVLKKGGMFSYNGANVGFWNVFFKKTMDDLGLKSDFIDEKVKMQTEKRDACIAMLGKHFAKTESVILSNCWHYNNADELLQRMKEYYPEQEKYIGDKANAIRQYFDKIIQENGEIKIEIGSQFWHCFN
ncbi:MAG: MerR family transcriptional regulator [Lachnospiraceae bacterium]|nr:MerR family transcriptional regulator [Lachnospiraceae bacterium]